MIFFILGFAHWTLCTHGHNLLKMKQVRHREEKKLQDFSERVSLTLIFGCLTQRWKHEPDVTDTRENVLRTRILLIIDLQRPWPWNFAQSHWAYFPMSSLLVNNEPKWKKVQGCLSRTRISTEICYDIDFGQYWIS